MPVHSHVYLFYPEGGLCRVFLIAHSLTLSCLSVAMIRYPSPLSNCPMPIHHYIIRTPSSHDALSVCGPPILAPLSQVLYAPPFQRHGAAPHVHFAATTSV
ncbi:hypothetical protein CGRA01v4_05058 [Colletotrichum graminicola]|nr:hypothetical protein CGRA01v4_05058 [Colletotrichum graminicola]